MLLEINAIDIVIMCSLYVSLSLAVITEPLSQTQRRLQTSGTCNNWTSSDSKMPRATAHAAIGHDQHTIWLLGDHSYGSNKRQLVSFNIHDHTFTDLGETALSYDVYGSATYYTQIEEFLWIADPQSDHFNRFNLHTMQFEYNYSSSIPVYYSCIASLTPYLFIVGYSVQILNINTQQWISNVPDMQVNRNDPSCIAHGFTLYGIGGWVLGSGSSRTILSSIETLNLKPLALNNIHNQQWSYIDSLHSIRYGSTAILYGDDILVVGGEKSFGSSTMFREIDVIDTSTSSVSLCGYLSYAVSSSSFIVLNETHGYAFGGANETVTSVNTWQYVGFELFPTVATTSHPTFPPTSNPTQSPVSQPTRPPTSADSDPTRSPTLRPSSSPVSSQTASTINTSSPTGPTRPPTLRPNVVSSEDVWSASSYLKNGSTMYYIVLIIGIMDVILIVFCLCYVAIKTRVRTRKRGNATYMQTIKCLVHSFGDVVGICVEMFDMTTDYLFAASLIIHNNGLGWISLMFAVCGLAIFFFKYSAYRTLIA
eukprot:220391_1